MAPDGLIVDHARVAGATRERVESLLGGLDNDAVGLFAGEVLVVPSLRVGLPVPGQSRGWRDALQRHVMGLAMGADMGAQGSSGAGRALRFRNEAAYWAWRIAEGYKSVGGAPARTAGASGRRPVPPLNRLDPVAFVALVVELARVGALREWMQALSPAEAATLEQRLAAHFGWSSVGGAAEPAQPAARISEGGHHRCADQIIEEIEFLLRDGNHWLQAVLAREMPERSDPIAQRLVVAILMMAWKPALAASPAYLHAIAQALAVPATETTALAGVRAQHRSEGRLEVGAAWEPHRDQSGQFPSSASPDGAKRGWKGEAVRPRVRTVATPGAIVEPPEVLTRSAPRDEPQQNRAQLSSLPEKLASLRFSSDFAGLLLLLNVFTALELYPDFTQPLGRRLAPSPLWLIDRLARLRFGARYRRDPLALWLGEQGVAGDLPRDWSAEPDWIEPFPRAKLSVERTRDRVTIWHGAGFPLADLSSRHAHRLPVVAGRLVRGMRPTRAARARLPRHDRWLACLAHFLDARIGLATGNPAMGLAALALPGEILGDALDLIVRFGLDSYPVALRLAGMDRDPGWYPAEGRSIAFAFA